MRIVGRVQHGVGTRRRPLLGHEISALQRCQFSIVEQHEAPHQYVFIAQKGNMQPVTIDRFLCIVRLSGKNGVGTRRRPLLIRKTSVMSQVTLMQLPDVVWYQIKPRLLQSTVLDSA